MRFILSTVLALAVAGAAYAASPALHAQSTEVVLPAQLGSIKKDLTVTVMNQGGKVVITDTVKHWLARDFSVAKVEQGSTCVVKAGTRVYTVAKLEGNLIVRAITAIGGGEHCPMGVRFALAPNDFEPTVWKK